MKVWVISQPKIKSCNNDINHNTENIASNLLTTNP